MAPTLLRRTPVPIPVPRPEPEAQISSSSSSSLPDTLLDLLHARAPISSPPPPLVDAAVLPTRTIAGADSLSPRLRSLAASVASLVGATRVLPRQAHATSAIPASYGAQNPWPDPGTVVGITLGSVAAFILVLWLIYTCMNIGNSGGGAEESASISVGTASVVARSSRRSHHHHHRGSRRETVEVRTRSRGPAAIVVEGAGPAREAVVVEERRRSVSRTRARAPMPPRVVSDDDDDEVVVIEEHSPPRRHRSKRRSDSARRESVYRETDRVEVRRSSGSRRR